jgi:glycosyltransferase involved in cell wall biosynthesis
VAVVGPGEHSAGGVSRVIATFLESPLAERFEFFRIATHRDGSAWVKAAQAVSAYLRLTALLMGRRVDLVWVHVASDWSFRRKVIAVALAWAGRRPYVLHVHGAHFDSYYRSASTVERALIRRVLRRAARVIALSRSWESKLIQMEPAASVTWVVNPVPFPSVAGRADGRLVVSLGRLSARKGSRVLLEAFGEIADTHPDVTLVLAGDGEVSELRTAAEEAGLRSRVRIPGWLEHTQAMTYLDAAIVFALPSQDEGLPIALLEAMARGVPCIVTPVGGIPDVVTDNVNGLLVAVDDPAALASALHRVLGDPAFARALGDQARETAAELFSVDAVASELTAVFEQAVAR